MLTKTTGGSSVKFVDGRAPHELAIDASDIYWLDSPRDYDSSGNLYPNSFGKVMKTSRASGDTMKLASDVQAPGGLAIDDTYVYFSSSRMGTLMKTPKE